MNTRYGTFYSAVSGAHPGKQMGFTDYTTCGLSSHALGVDSVLCTSVNIQWRWTEAWGDSAGHRGPCLGYWFSWNTQPITAGNFWQNATFVNAITPGVEITHLQIGSPNTLYHAAVMPVNKCGLNGLVYAEGCACTRQTNGHLGTKSCGEP